MQSLFSYVQVITPQVTKYIELEGVGHSDSVVFL